MPPGGLPMTLRPVVEQLLLDVVADGFVLYCCGDRTAPTALVASYEWADYIDVVTIRNFERVTAARVPIDGKMDVFALKVVVWCYVGPAEWALRALLNLVHPKHPDAPTAPYPAPPSLHIPRAEQRPMTIRPPSPDRANVRASRLAVPVVTSFRSRSSGDLDDQFDFDRSAQWQLSDPDCGPSMCPGRAEYLAE